MMKKNKLEKSDNYFVSVGFAEPTQNGELDYENFPSKLCGLPVWLIPPDISDNFFLCIYCDKNLYFLTQIYCPLEDNTNSFHRVIYIFFCKDCWKINNALKALRVQLPEISNFYNGENLLVDLKNSKIIQRINRKINTLLPEYLIDSYDERPTASKMYINFYDKIDEKSSSNLCLDDLSDQETDINESDDKINKMLEDYCKEQGINIENDLDEEIETEFINKVEKNIFGRRNSQDIFYELFSKILSFDPKQVIRYCRDGIFPLWFSSYGMLTMKNTKCKNCGGELIFEFQVMIILI
jgi:hypothetical protein